MLRLQELSAQQRERTRHDILRLSPRSSIGERQEEEASKQRAMVHASSGHAMERLRARTDALRAAQAQMQDMLYVPHPRDRRECLTEPPLVGSVSRGQADSSSTSAGASLVCARTRTQTG